MNATVPDILFVSLENWDDVWRRNQFVCAGLARRYPATKILFVAPARDVSNGLRRGKLSALKSRPTWTVPGLPNVTVAQPLKLFPNSLAAGRAVNQAMFRGHVRRVARALGMNNPVLWLNPQDAVHMVGRTGEGGVIYDITDDWTSLSQSASVRRRVVRDDAALCARADAVVVCSERLHAMKLPITQGTLHLIPNGVEVAHYASVLDGNGQQLPEPARAWPRPVLGYTGTIHPDRVDVDLVEAVACKLTAGSIALVGPNCLSDPDRARLTATGRVFLTGPVPYEQVPRYMRAFDVCVTPHRVTPFTESLNPIKLWEYLAAGKPIVSTGVAGFRDYPQFVRVVSGGDAGAFVAAAQAALAEDRTVADARRREASRHSWDARLDVIESVIRACAEPRAAEHAPFPHATEAVLAS